jgi:hypothetical protein
MKFYSVVEKESEKLLWDLVEFENGNISGYSYEYNVIFIYDSLNEFIELEGKENEQIIEDGIREE